ncbi:MAG: nitronate monooxygenase [Anaerolineales bacterium]|nr:nitronate monooxygenase [Anaerolineales bacterium]
MKLFEIIQGGMGVAISNWNLARTVSMQGQLGVVSGTGIHLIMAARLMEGDIDGHVRRALSNFPFQEPVQRILKKYFIQKPKLPRLPYKRPPMWTLNPSKSLTELTVIANFVEIFLAKEGHPNPVGLNLLEKIQMPTMASLYGALLAGVDFVIMGAGIPVQIPGILDKLANHQDVSYRLDVTGSVPDDNYQLRFDPKAIFSEATQKIQQLSRPYFLPIISSVVLAKSLIRRSTGKVDGFIVEGHTAGGHNAPPRGAMLLDEKGEPIFGEKDTPDIEKIKQLGLPFWLAGGYETPEKLREAKDAGATGIQVGTAFAFCDESGMDADTKRRVIQKVVDEEVEVYTDPHVSPTGYPFKVVQLENTMSDPEIYNQRDRICDIGLLREPYIREDGKVGYRCPAEPEDQYLKKGGEHDDLVGRGCLCNNLCASAGYPQHREDGSIEQPLVTSGKSLSSIGKFFKPGHRNYSAKDVLDYIKGGS